MSPHRTPGEVLPDGSEPLRKGPAEKCKGCGSPRRVDVGSVPNHRPSGGYTPASALREPRACTPRRRLGWLWWRCRVPGEHLHERCKVCGLEWLTAFAEGA